MKSDVYFVECRQEDSVSRQQALEKLLQEISPWFEHKADELVPVKITIGDAPCVYHVHPELVKSVIALIKAKKAKPFLFDTSVIYHGERQNALDHLTLAQRKGFDQARTGVPFIVADGLLGHDGKEYEINAAHIKKVKVPSFVGMLESLVVLSHATGHIFSGFAGAIKNVAMGMSARATKQVQHSSLKPAIEQNKCTACGCCIKICPVHAIALNQRKKAEINLGDCIGCGECLCACKFEAVIVNWDEDMDIFTSRMDEVAKFILAQFKHKIFITFAFDITQECDCISTKDDRKVSKDVGILASRDVLSLDRATADLLTDDQHFFKDHNAYQHMFSYAAHIGLGSLEYQLIKL